MEATPDAASEKGWLDNKQATIGYFDKDFDPRCFFSPGNG